MHYRRYLGPLLGTLILILFFLLPPWGALTASGMRAVGIFFFTIIWWISEGVGYPSFLAITLIIASGVLPADQTFSVSLGNWIIFFLLGCFGMCEALRLSGFTHRFALWFLTRPMARGRPWVLLSLFFLACTLMAAVMSVTATVIVFMTVAGSMLRALDYRKGDLFGATLMMGIAWTATAAFAMTPIAHVNNLMMIEWLQRDLGYGVSFARWMAVGVPMGLVFYLVIVGFIRLVIRPDVSRMVLLTREYLEEQVRQLGPVSLQEKISAGIFGIVIAIWMLPDLASPWLPQVATYFRQLGYAAPALAGSAALCFIHVQGKPLLTFRQWMVEGTEWGSVALVAGVLALGAVISDPSTGILRFLADSFGPLARGMPIHAFVLLTVLWTTLQTNVLSNLVSMTMVYSIMVPIATEAGLGNPAALGVTVAASASYAFALPSATTATALVIGSGWVPLRHMLRYGFLLVIPVALLFTFLYYPFASLILR